ncbi:MAG: two-component regulator propeller domain-containing protein [Paludibacter sp.]
MSRNLVDYIFRDSRGFMWLCTSKGLDRYDGYEFIHFDSRSPVNPLQSDNVHCVQEDINGDLWIGTENGLYFLNYKTGEILNSAKKLNSKQSFTNRQIIFINKDEQGNLWVGYNSGLAKIHITGSEISAEEVYHSNTPITACLIYNGNILLSRDNEIFRLIKNNNGKYQRINADNKLRRFTDAVNALYYDNGFIWVGTANGLYKYEPASETLSRYFTTFSKPNELTSSYITDITKNKEGQLLIGTLIGLNIYDYHTDSFTGITSESFAEGVALNNNFINCLLVVDNTIWIGTDKGGVNLLSPNQNILKTLAMSRATPTVYPKIR